MAVPVPASADRDLDVRLREHGLVSPRLARLGDDELSSLLAAGDDTRGIGGGRAVLDVDGTTVFVKRLPLTDREQEAGAVGSTANLFGLPAHCHFGVSSPGFGAWRELAASAEVSRWVLDRRTEHFPLLHHWRVLPGAPLPGDEFSDIEASVDFWGGHPAIRERLLALAGASSSVVLFLEHVPTTLSSWLDSRTGSARATPAALTMLETQLRAGAGFMAAQGLVHFDAHFDNVLTDGRRLYFADFGLAATSGFRLSHDEAGLVGQAATHDLGYVMARLVNWVVSTWGDPSCARDPVVRNDHVRAFARGASTEPIAEPAASIVRRYAPVAAVVNDFYADLFTVRRDAPYPAAAVGREVDRLWPVDS